MCHTYVPAPVCMYSVDMYLCTLGGICCRRHMVCVQKACWDVPIIAQINRRAPQLAFLILTGLPHLLRGLVRYIHL